MSTLAAGYLNPVDAFRFISTLNNALPTDPKRIFPGELVVKTGLVSVNPYPSRIITFKEAKNSATSGDRGAPPDIKNLILPPVFAFILL